MAFEHALTVRFYEIDRAGIAFFGRFFEYCHTAFEEMLAAALGDLERTMTDLSWSLPLVHADADFAAPVRYGDRLIVALEVERVGETSVTFRYTVRAAADGTPRAKVKLVHACI